MPTADQIYGLIERLVTIGLTYAAAKGYVDVKLASDLGPVLIAIAAAAYAWWINRPKALVQSAAALPGTVVVAPSPLAESTPERNIVSTALPAARELMDKVRAS